MRDSYTSTVSPNPHIQRARELLRTHPEVKLYFGPYPLSALYIAAVVLFQLVTAYLLREASWAWVIACAYLVGAFASHALFVLIHDAGHNLIVKDGVANRLFGILCNVGQGVPSAMSFRAFHALHHSHLDEYDYDGDLAYHGEARWVGNSPWRKAVWLFFFGLIEIVRPLRIKRATVDRWILLNFALIAVTDTAIWYLCGVRGLAFILLSTIFGIGLHPLGARWVQEHYTFVSGQETYSYYGILNRVAFNIGYHNEHHDLPRVAWAHLPKVRRMAPEFYNNIYAHRSLTKVLFQFLFDRDLDLYTRITRERSEVRAAQQREAA